MVVIVAFARNKSTDRVPVAENVAPEKSSDTKGRAVGVAVSRGVPAVSDAMNGEPYYVGASATMGEVVQMLDRFGTSGVPVVDDGLKVIGFVSDGDIASYLGRHDASIFDPKLNLVSFYDSTEFHDLVQDLMALNVMKVATTHVISVDKDLPLDKAIHTLSERRIKKMPVVDAEGKLVGTLSRRDVIRAMVRSDPRGCGNAVDAR